MIKSVELYQNTKIVENSVQPQKKAESTNFSSILDNTVKASEKSSKTSMDNIFKSASKKYNVPENLLKAVAKAESGFDPKAVSHCGAQGVMQLMPQTAKSLGVTNSFDPEQNIMGGAKYLSQMLDKYDGDTKLALAAYNAGSGNVAKYGGIPPFKETQNYVVKVTKYMNEGTNALTLPLQSNQTANGPVNNEKQTETNMDSNNTNSNGNTPALTESENPDDIFSYSDYLRLIQELNTQMQLLYLERNMNVVHNISSMDNGNILS